MVSFMLILLVPSQEGKKHIFGKGGSLRGTVRTRVRFPVRAVRFLRRTVNLFTVGGRGRERFFSEFGEEGGELCLFGAAQVMVGSHHTVEVP